MQNKRRYQWEENVRSYFHIIHLKCGLSFSFVYVCFLFIHLSFLMDLGIHAECTWQKKKITFINHNLPLGAAACAALVSAILELLR